MIKVFPSESVARSYLFSEARDNPGKTILNSTFMSWDTFKKNCTEIPSGKKECTYLERRIFAEEFLSNKENTCKINYYYNHVFPEGLSASASLIAEEVSGFSKALIYNNTIRKDIYRDMKLIASSYVSFLDENNLYDENYLIPDFSKADSDTVLYYPSAVSDPDVLLALKCGFKTVENKGDIPVLRVYKNTLTEIKDTFRRIRKLLESGVKAYDIALTVASLKDNYPYVIQEAENCNVKIHTALGKKLSEYQAGKFFTVLQNVVISCFSFDSVKEVFLNTSFPFANREMLLSIIKNAVELKINSGMKNAELWVSKFERNGLTDEAEFMKKFAQLATMTVLSEDVLNLKLSLRRFQDEFFENASWDSTCRSDDIMAFQRCMQVLDDIENSPYKMTDPYGLLVNVLQHTTYVVPSDNNGIAVYPYPLSCGLNIPYHFVICLDDKACSIGRSYLKNTDSTETDDISSDVLNSYFTGKGNSVFSGSSETFKSGVTSPSLFEKNRKTTKFRDCETDFYSVEEQVWKNAVPSDIKCTQKQKEAFNRALASTLLQCPDEDNAAIDISSLRFSATQLGVYEKCPFRWYLQYGLKIKDEDFSPVMEDALEIGNLLHRTYEEYLNTKRVFISDKDLLLNIFKKQIEAEIRKTTATDKIHIVRIKEKYSEILDSLFSSEKSQLLTGSELIETEQFFEFENNSVTERGFIDCVLKTASGDCILIDFKKGTLPKDSLQLLVYCSAVKNRTGEYPSAALFYSVEKESFKAAFKNETERDELMSDLDERILNAVESITNNRFETTSDEESCKECNYRRICRRRYVIK